MLSLEMVQQSQMILSILLYRYIYQIIETVFLSQSLTYHAFFD